MAVPFAMGRIIDMIYKGGDADSIKSMLVPFCQVLAIVFVLGAAANFGRVYLIQTSGKYYKYVPHC